MSRVPWLALAVLACAEPSLKGRLVHARVLPVETAAPILLDAVMPSDALVLDDGSVLVLDGYGGQVLRVDAGAVRPFSTESVGRASRLSPAADGGIWVTRPGSRDEAGSLLHLDASGARVGVLVPRRPEGGALHPVDVLDTDGALIVADRTQGLLWLDGDGVVSRAVTEIGGGESVWRIVDLVAVPGGMLGVDILAPRVVSLAADGAPKSAFGVPGLAVGRFARPTALALAPGGLLVSDSILGAVQAYDLDGTMLGVLGDGETPLRLGHPVAVRTNPRAPGVVAVLEVEPAQLRILHLTETLPPAVAPPLLRTTLVAADADPAGENGKFCAQCHDGLLRDSRQVWDPARKHHPVGMVPDRPLPSFFPLEQGAMTCATCHSPHGTVDEVADDTAPLVRHAAADAGFLRLDAKSDALCIACHADNVHAPATSEGRATIGGGHPAGAALVAALKARGDDEDLTKARCLSCHAVHGAAADPLLRASDDASACLACHPAKQDPATNHPLAPSAVATTEAGEGCLMCHDLTSPARALLRTGARPETVCLDCHDQQSDVVDGAHRSLGKPGAPACTACHDLHGAARAFEFVATGPSTDADPRGCLSCHAGGRDGSPGRLGHPVTGEQYEAGDGGTLDCLACHDPHQADTPTSGDCVQCHAAEGAAKKAGGHGTAACLDCHPAHRADPGWSGPDNPATGRCLACHAVSRGTGGARTIAHYQHPAPLFQPDGKRWKPLAGLVLFGPDGEPVAPGENGDLTCQSCHVVHGPDGAADHLRRATGWQAACAACHGDDSLVFYRDFHEPERRAALMGSPK